MCWFFFLVRPGSRETNRRGKKSEKRGKTVLLFCIPIPFSLSPSSIFGLKKKEGEKKERENAKKRRRNQAVSRHPTPFQKYAHSSDSLLDIAYPYMLEKREKKKGEGEGKGRGEMIRILVATSSCF